MKRWLLIIPLWLAGVWGSRAAEAPLRASGPEVRREVLAVIDAQLAAFRAHDALKAYALAAFSLRQQFPLARFLETVRQNYPDIWSNVRADYSIVQDNGAQATLRVRIFGPGGDSVSYDYILYKEPAGWRIASVLKHPAAAGADRA